MSRNGVKVVALLVSVFCAVNCATTERNVDNAQNCELVKSFFETRNISVQTTNNTYGKYLINCYVINKNSWKYVMCLKHSACRKVYKLLFLYKCFESGALIQAEQVQEVLLFIVLSHSYTFILKIIQN